MFTDVRTSSDLLESMLNEKLIHILEDFSVSLKERMYFRH